MYTKKSFDKYPMFKDIINRYGMVNFLDPLTKTILRGHMMTYVDKLIREKFPFSLIILDIDNFKQINDNYGHQIGDRILQETAKNIIEYVGDSGLVGRYGGDEFIIVDKDHTDYDSMHKFLTDLYMDVNVNVLRKDLKIDQMQIFITGTIGTANFPNDATDYDDLFNKADKALYRGKMKGRNCFIIYVHEKHKDIDISKLIKEPIQNIFHSLDLIFEKDSSLVHKLEEGIKYLKEKLKITDVFCFTKKGKLVSNKADKNVVNSFDEIIDDIGFSAYNTIDEVYNDYDDLDKFIDKYNLACLLIGKITFKNELYGYLLFADSSVQRIWQNEDIAILIFVMRLIGTELYLSEK